MGPAGKQTNSQDFEMRLHWKVIGFAQALLEKSRNWGRSRRITGDGVVFEAPHDLLALLSGSVG